MTSLDDPIAGSALELVDQPLLYQHCRIAMPQGQVLGENAFSLERFQGQESASDLFEYQLELHGDTATGDAAADAATLDFATVIGRPVTVGIGTTPYSDRDESHLAFRRALDGTGPKGAFALFNGIVAALAIELPGVYRITMRPAAWRMGLTNRYRVFTQKSICDVLEQLCREHGVEASFSGLKGSDNLATCRVQDWFQAGETDLDFLRRLMSKAHIYYYFRHEADRHVMVFDNRPTYPPAIPGDTALRYTWTATDALGMHQGDVVSQYSYQQSLGVSGVQGIFTLQTEAWDVTQPGDPLASFTTFRADSRPDTGDLPFRQHKVVQYGFSTAQVREFAQATESAIHSGERQFSGASFCPLLRAGHRFRMETDMPDVRPELNGVEFVLTQVQHESVLDGEYNNHFSATPADGLISATGLQDTQQGVVLAHVASPGGDDAVQHWPYYIPDDFSLGRNWLADTQGVHKRLHAKGVYVRFATDPPGTPPVWVKLAAHMQTIPEVGACVWVSRANDESEIPEIQNMVQADGTKTITDSGWTAHSQVGNSFSTSYGDSRSIHFGQPWSRADVDAAVKLVEAAYGRKLFRDASYSRGGSYGYSTSEQGADGMLNESWSYGSTYGNSWGKEQISFSATGASRHQSVVGKYKPTEADAQPVVDADASAAVQSSISTVHGDTYAKSTSNGKTKSISTYNGAVSNESTHNGKVTSKTDIFADSENTSTITGVSSNRSTHNIEHNVSTVNAQSNSSAIGASNSNSAIGVSNSNSVVGLHNSNDAVGVSINLSATGASTRNSLLGISADTSLQGMSNALNIVGMDNRLSVTGSSNHLSVTGDSSSVSVTGSSTVVEVAGPGVHVSAKSPQAKIDLDGPVMQIPVIVLVL